MVRENLIKLLNGDLSLVDQVHYVVDMPDPVIITPDHVRAMLLRFLNHEVSASDLNNWARCLYPNEGYSEGYPRNSETKSKLTDEECDAIEDYYKDMSDVIFCLALPHINYEITEESVTRYVRELDKYKDDKYAHLRIKA